jgi:AraC-like DNA-binding protein
MPITSIGYEVGFKDPSYFARAFKQFAGSTPSDYRQARRAGVPIPLPVKPRPALEAIPSEVIDSLLLRNEA